MFILSLVGCLLLLFSHTNKIDRLFPDWLINPIYMYILLSLSLFLPTSLLLFCKEAIYQSWKKFTLFYTPLFLLMILFALGGSGGMSGIGEGFAFFLAGLYSFLSLLIIIIQSIRLRGKPETEELKSE